MSEASVDHSRTALNGRTLELKYVEIQRDLDRDLGEKRPVDPTKLVRQAEVCFTGGNPDGSGEKYAKDVIKVLSQPNAPSTKEARDAAADANALLGVIAISKERPELRLMQYYFDQARTLNPDQETVALFLDEALTLDELEKRKAAYDGKGNLSAEEQVAQRFTEEAIKYRKAGFISDTAPDRSHEPDLPERSLQVSLTEEDSKFLDHVASDLKMEPDMTRLLLEDMRQWIDQIVRRGEDPREELRDFIREHGQKGYRIADTQAYIRAVTTVLDYVSPPFAQRSIDQTVLRDRFVETTEITEAQLREILFTGTTRIQFEDVHHRPIIFDRIGNMNLAIFDLPDRSRFPDGMHRATALFNDLSQYGNSFDADGRGYIAGGRRHGYDVVQAVWLNKNNYPESLTLAFRHPTASDQFRKLWAQDEGREKIWQILEKEFRDKELRDARAATQTAARQPEARRESTPTELESRLSDILEHTQRVHFDYDINTRPHIYVRDRNYFDPTSAEELTRYDIFDNSGFRPEVSRAERIYRSLRSALVQDIGSGGGDLPYYTQYGMIGNKHILHIAWRDKEDAQALTLSFDNDNANAVNAFSQLWENQYNNRDNFIDLLLQLTDDRPGRREGQLNVNSNTSTEAETDDSERRGGRVKNTGRRFTRKAPRHTAT